MAKKRKRPGKRPAVDRTRELRGAIAEAIREKYARRIRRGRLTDKAGTFELRLAPKARDYAAGELGVGGFDPRSAGERNALERAIRPFVSHGAEPVRKGSLPYPSKLAVVPEAARYAFASAREAMPVGGDILAIRDEIDRVLAGVSRSSWAGRYLRQARARVVEQRSPHSWELHRERMIGLCRALEILDGLEDPIFIRVLSVRATGNSKLIEQSLKTAIAASAEEGGFEFQYPTVDGRIHELGIWKVRPLIRLAGAATLTFGDLELDLGPYGPEGTYISGEMAGRISGIRTEGPVLIIENSTNYARIARQFFGSCLVIDGEGFPTGIFYHLLRALDAHLPQGKEVFDWADIDLGGFQIIRSHRKACRRIVPFMMGVEEFEAVPQEMRLARTEAYLKECVEHLDRYPQSEFTVQVLAILECKRTVEQEALLNGFAQLKIHELIRQGL